MVYFSKFQGTGNDFILIDNRDNTLTSLSKERIQKACDRRFGIGADGLILLNNSNRYDFYMDYYNSDGSQSFCGNGARCAVAFAKKCGIDRDKFQFEAIDGVHFAEITPEDLVKLRMGEISEFQSINQDWFIHTGSPHYVHFVSQLERENVVEFGRSIRYNDRFKSEGTNVNLAECQSNGIAVSTYERGVEDETLSCGTGVTAVALIWAELNNINEGQQKIYTKGGELMVQWRKENNNFVEVYLIGPAEFVYEGKYEF
jgi:diaminopimelate epimerase